MNFLHKTLLLLNIRQQCQTDRKQSWQQLHQRDREWFLQQKQIKPWPLLQNWLTTFSLNNAVSLSLLGHLGALIGFILGISLMAGLVQFQTLQGINILWWLLLAVWLPFIGWVFGLLISRNTGPSLWQQLLISRLPNDWQRSLDLPLIRLSAITLAQQFSFWFSLGLIACFTLYLTLTDLVFNWSSTLDISANSIFNISQLIAWPWQAIWPQATPTLEMIEKTRFFHTQAIATDNASIHGQWWRFLLMNLLAFNLLPRMLSYSFFRLRLLQAHKRLFKQDACLADWWQRLHFENVQQETDAVKQADIPVEENTQYSEPQQNWPSIQQVYSWGQWPEAQLQSIQKSLPQQFQTLPFDKANSLSTPASHTNVLLLCKGWEPPTGALKDYCSQYLEKDISFYLWPAPLPSMSQERAALLARSWNMAMPEFPENCHLLEPHKHV